jgi:nucleoside-diphosphate-sugar epimerase
MKILITGGSGYIAKSLHVALSKQYEITSITRKDFDLTDRKSTDEWFKLKHFDVVIHTAIKGGHRLAPDSGEIFYQNLQMFYNLFYNKDKFGKFIYFGSGAELGSPSSPYGLSKKIINDLIKYEHGFFNIRIFGVFDENELDTRFIKASINRYINNEEIIIHQDKQMDFFYMKDLVSLVKQYLQGNSMFLPKISECSYREKYTLLDIANIINILSNYKVSIKLLDSSKGVSYIGETTPNLKVIGLEQGIKEVYNKLKNEY